MGLTYRDAGVDIDRGESLVERIKTLAARTRGPGDVSGIGGFASLFALKPFLERAGGMTDPLLVSGTDGVGTKLKVAFMTGQHDSVGIDLVAMCVNDIVTTGAQPLFFLDYFASGKLDVGVGEAVVAGIAEGCVRAGCSLVGGETAELPGFYADGEYDLAGFVVGLVDRPKAIDGRRVAPGDVIIGVASHGLHANGFSLARKVLFEHAGHDATSVLPQLSAPLGQTLLTPTAIYARLVQSMLTRVEVKAMAHITGGGLAGNLPRVLPEAVAAHVERGRWTPAPIFGLIQELGSVADDEMFRTFNMGVGLAVVVDPQAAQEALSVARSAGEQASIIGHIHPRTDGDAPQFVLHDATQGGDL